MITRVAMSLCMTTHLFCQSDAPQEIKRAIKLATSYIVIVNSNNTDGGSVNFNKLCSSPATLEYDIALHTCFSDEAKRWLNSVVANQPGWVLLDRDENILARGLIKESEEQILCKMLASGLKSPTMAYKKFLSIHPDHQEARSEYISILDRIAVKKIRSLTEKQADCEKINTDVVYSQWGNVSGKATATNLKISNALDYEIWGGLAQELDKLFTDKDWFIAPINPSDESVSSIAVRKIVSKHIKTIETHLSNSPNNLCLWYIWLWANRVLDRDLDINLIKTMKPFDPKSGSSSTEVIWPPPIIISSLVEQAKKNNKLGAVVDILWPIYIESNIVRELIDIDQNNIKNDSMIEIMHKKSEEIWTVFIQPLLEAAARTKQDEKVHKIISDVIKMKYLDSPEHRIREVTSSANSKVK